MKNLSRRHLLRALAVLPASAAVSGCNPAIWAGLAKVAQGTQWLGSLIDVADAGQKTYFNRHPNMDSEAKVSLAVRAARVTLVALNKALAAAKAIKDGNVDAARSDALAAYEALRSLLGELRVLEAKPPDGGPETEAPKPQPIDLPPKDEVAARLSA